MQTMTLCMFRLFSTVRNSASVPMSMPSSARAARVSASRRFLKSGIDPGAGDHLGAQRRRAAVHEVDLGGDLLRRQHALLDQQRADRLLQHLVGAGRTRVVVLLRRRVRMGMVVAVIVVVMIVVMIVVVIVHLCLRSYFAGSSQCS